MTINTTTQALVKARNISYGYGGMCLLFVQTCYNAEARYSSAYKAWQGSTTQHKTTDLSKIPIGAPIYFAPHGNPYGHIAIYEGNGNMRTTNSATGRVSTNSVKLWQSWGYQLLGYTTDIENQNIPDLTPKTEKESETMNNSDIQKIAEAVWNTKIGADGTGVNGKNSDTANRILSYIHLDGMYNRSLLDRIKTFFIKNNRGFSTIGDLVACHPYGNGDGNKNHEEELWKRVNEIETKLDTIINTLNK